MHWDWYSFYAGVTAMGWLIIIGAVFVALVAKGRKK